MITDEKRAFKRVKRKFTVKYELHDSLHPFKGSSVSENISLGGVYFLSLEELKIGQLVDCAIMLPEISSECKWQARVVRCEKISEKIVTTFGVAVEFIKAEGDSDKKLQRALKSQL